MVIPDYQTVMLPLLRHLEDGQEHLLDECFPSLAGHFGLSEEEQRELLPSGRQPVFLNRVGWATTYLSKAGLIERTARKRVRITARGYEALRSNLERIDNDYLLQFAEFAEFSRRAPKVSGELVLAKVNVTETSAEPSLSPDEMLEASYQRLRQSLAQNLLERVKHASPSFFEQLVVDLLVSMGYRGSRRDAGQAVGGSGDGGIDGIIKEDRLGLDFVYIQAKRWDGPVSRPTVQAFAGSLEGQRARKGVLITTSRFTNDAEEYVKRIEKRIVLIDGEQLAQLMLDYGVGVTEVANYRVQRVDLDYFGEEQ
jgi:restriction system protein